MHLVFSYLKEKSYKFRVHWNSELLAYTNLSVSLNLAGMFLASSHYVTKVFCNPAESTSLNGNRGGTEWAGTAEGIAADITPRGKSQGDRHKSRTDARFKLTSEITITTEHDRKAQTASRGAKSQAQRCGCTWSPTWSICSLHLHSTSPLLAGSLKPILFSNTCL